MSGRVELSTSWQDAEPQPAAAASTSVALIGPDDARRRIVSKALMNSEAGFVQEFNVYPTGANDISRLMDMGFGVIMIDVDGDEKHALSLVENIAALGTVTVMVYSRRNDPDLLMRSMRAGAREFLPLPEEEDGSVAEHKLQPAPIAGDSLIEPVARPFETHAPSDVETIKANTEEEALLPQENEAAPTGAAGTDFNEWDKTWVMSAKPMAKGLRSTMRAALAPALPVKSEPKRAVVHSIAEASGHVAEKSELEERQLFRSAVDSQVIKQDGGWMKWLLIAGGIAAAIGIAVLVFMHPSHQNAPTAAQVEYVVPPSPQPAPSAQTTAAVQTAPIAKPSAQGQNAKTATVNGAESAQTDQAPAADMDAQLAAPSRISIKQPAAVGEAPSDSSPIGMDNGGNVPSAVFGSASKARVVPAVSAISAGVAAGMLVHRTSPVYPKFALETHTGGTVVLKATITKSGNLTNVHVLSGPPMLVSAAIEAVKTWRYRPYLLDNQPIEVDTTIDVIFNLGKS